MTLTAIPTENLLKEKQQHKDTTKTIANPLRTVSWSEYSHPNVVVNLIYEPHYTTPAIAGIPRRSKVVKV